MTDIVERLRSGYNPPAFWLEAADEIERLRAQVARMTVALKNVLEVLPAKTPPADVVRALLEGK